MEELINRAAKGDQAAIYTLVQDTFKESLFKIAYKYNIQNDADVEEMLSQFFERLITPTESGELRLRNISSQSSPKSYIGKSFDNFLKDVYEKKARLNIINGYDESRKTMDNDNPFDDEARLSTDISSHSPEGADADEKHEKIYKEKMIESLLESFDFIDTLSDLDRYILLTFLVGERFKGDGRPLKLRISLGKQLDMNASTVYNRYADNKRLLADRAKEILRRKLNN